jgi:thymidylate synthase
MQVCNLKPGELVYFLGDAHVYSNHVEALQEQLQNVPRAFPTLHISPQVKDIDRFKFSDFEIRDYNPHKKIAMKMAV